MLAPDKPRQQNEPAAALLGFLLMLGSLLLVAIPVGWLWLLSQIDQPYMAVYFLALGGCPLMMVAWGMLLVRLNRTYVRLSGHDDRDGRILEVGVALSVLLAVLILAAWLFLYPHGGGPVQGPWPG
jgi:membrane protease YdiL (CAAX protease family)